MQDTNKYSQTDWLPTTVKEAKVHGWSEMDVVLFTGDAYVDHPSFGTAVVGRLLESLGLKVAVVPQPNWKDDLRDFKKFGKPRLFFGVSAGNMDSMVNHYTAMKRLRSNDAYTPGGEAGKRPDYACSVYSQILKELYPDVPVIIGGIEASLRRVTHYDYWQDKLRPSILADSKADMLVYGMGEKPLTQIVRLMQKGVPLHDLQTLNQTVFFADSEENLQSKKSWETHELYPHEVCVKDKYKYAENFKHIETESNRFQSKRLVQKVGGRLLVVNPPYPPFSEKEMDDVYELPFTYLPHFKYRSKKPIPAYEMIKFSVNSHRGCFGGCSFCTISAHQGKFISQRSSKSILKEVEKLSNHPEFKGYLTDLGGPSANMYNMQGKDLGVCKNCKRPSCIFPSICKNLNTDHKQLSLLYKTVRNLPYVKQLTIGSGVRYDLLSDNTESSKEYKEELISHHVSGRLKVAPEHTDDNVLRNMRKPSFSLFEKFKIDFERINQKAGKNQQIIPYFISSHPGSEKTHMQHLADSIKRLNVKPEQVQDFTPTPMTLATVIYYSGVDPYTGKEVYTAKSKTEKQEQKDMFFWYVPKSKLQQKKTFQTKQAKHKKKRS